MQVRDQGAGVVVQPDEMIPQDVEAVANPQNGGSANLIFRLLSDNYGHLRGADIEDRVQITTLINNIFNMYLGLNQIAQTFRATEEAIQRHIVIERESATQTYSMAEEAMKHKQYSTALARIIEAIDEYTKSSRSANHSPSQNTF